MIRMQRLQTVLQAMREILQDAERHGQPRLICREFFRLRAEAVALHASLFPGPPDAGEIVLLSRKAEDVHLDWRSQQR